MKKPMLVLIVLIVIIAGTWAYLLLVPAKVPKPEVKFPADQKVSAKEKNTVTINNFSFDQTQLTIKAGETVTWVNEDGVVHKLKSNDFNSPNLKNGDSYKFIFTKAGTYEYTCDTHPYMKGKVVVE